MQKQYLWFIGIYAASVGAFALFTSLLRLLLKAI